MLDSAPKESELRSWAYVVLGVLVIYATIPLARGLRDAVDATIGREFFLYLVLLLASVFAFLAFINLRRRALPPDAYYALGLVLLVLMTLIYRLRDIPEEALHVAEYALLGLLVYRALVHRIRDYSIYPVACLVVGMIGIIDEYIQWVMPSRYYDVGDILVNLGAGALAQIGIATGLRPGLVSSPPTRRSWSRLCYVAAAALVLLSVAFVNTPARVARYAASFEPLLFLLDGQSNMAEYGYRYEGPETGIFRSRFDRAALRELDRSRGEAVARILDRYIRGEGYRAFLRAHSVLRDAYAHEAGVHLFRREFHLDRARENNSKRAEHYSIAYRENQILRQYFPSVINRSRHRWSSAVEEEVRQNAQASLAPESAVSQSVITRLGETQVILMFATATGVLIYLGIRLGRRRRDDGEA